MTGARMLGVVLAGGQATRFGRDKALAEIDGRSLLDRAVAALARQCDAVVVAGRHHACGLADRPRAAMGPLGGLNAALHHGAAQGFDLVLSIPVDALALPGDLAGELSPAPAYAANAPVIGLWPVAAHGVLDGLLAETTGHAMRAFATRIGARAVYLSRQPRNINTAADLIAAQAIAAKDHAHGL